MGKHVIVTLLLILSFAVQAQEADDSDSVDILAPEEFEAAAKDAKLANNLAVYGEEHSDALSLIVAATIAKNIPGSIAYHSGESGPSETGSSRVDLAAKMLARAKELAGDRDDLLALILDVEAEKTRGGWRCFYINNYGGFGEGVGPTRSRAKAWARGMCLRYGGGYPCYYDECWSF